MNLFLIPMWLLSGAFFPVDGAPSWLRAAMAVNPLTYGVAALRRALGGAAPAWISPSLSLAVTAAFAVLMFAAAVAVVARFPAGPAARLAAAQPAGDPMTVRDLPTLNACLNATSAVLLVVGWTFIRRRRRSTRTAGR